MSRQAAPRITLYSTHRCPHCRQVRQWLQQRGLRFQEFDIERNARAFKAFQRLGARSVPITLVGDERVDGFDPKRLQRLLSGHPYDRLDPDCILDAIEATGLLPSGHVLALNSYENRVYQIGIEDEPPLIAKFYRPKRWSDRAIFEEHAFSLELARQEIPVVAPLAPGGRTLLAHQGFRFALFPRQGGHAPEPEDLDQLEWIGRFLGRIHRVGQAAPFRERVTLGTAHYGWRAREIVLASPLLPPEHREHYAGLTAQLLETVEGAMTRIHAATLRLHGDCHPGNILWTDNGPHFVDMDDCCSGPAIQDLWMLLSGDRQDMTLQLDALLEGYRTFHDFDPAELALIEPLRSLRLIHYTGWLVQRWDDPAFPAVFPWLAEPGYWPGYLADLEEQLLDLGY